MREIIVVLVQTITDLFDCLPKDVYATEKIVRIEATLARVQQTLAERQRHGQATQIELTVAQIGLAGSDPPKPPRKRLRNTPGGHATLFGV